MRPRQQAQPRSKAHGTRTDCAKPPADDANPVRNRDGILPAQRRFCREYVLDWNGTQAAIRAGYSPKTAGSQAHDLLKKPEIRTEIGRLEREAAEKLEIQHTDLLKRLWDTATGDVNDLVRIERRACRYCHGVGHEYQWTTLREYRDAADRFLLDTAKGNASALAEMTERIDAGRRIPGMPRDAGGYGFNATAMPSPDCPECAGEGIMTVHVTDTREAVSHPLYEGVKQTKDGIEVKIADRAKALEQVARHMSFFKDAMQLSASDELMEAARKINAASPPLDARYMAKNASRLLGDEAEK
ncbi:terminase small subunit [Aquicoccus sp.]|uniref:terminase small subunit n=1 Tax=Aquicoccus sp. TaxID=2055851 RepID=UPI003565B781